MGRTQYRNSGAGGKSLTCCPAGLQRWILAHCSVSVCAEHRLMDTNEKPLFVAEDVRS